MKEKEKIAVIGGGAAGFFGAINIARMNPELEVTIYEKTSKLLSKVKISGGGRCNVTHACFDPKELSDNYPRGQKELLGPFNHYNVSDLIEWFDERGVELKVEEDGRMFPITDSSQTIIDCFLEEVNLLGVQIKTNSEVKEIKKGDRFKILVNGESISADKILVTIGGNAKLKHYEFLQKLDLKLKNPIPSLFTFNLPKHPSNKLMGLSVNAELRLNGTKYEEYGPVLFTHWGMSGPAILKLSARAAEHLHNCSYQFEYTVSWMQGVDDQIALKRSNEGKKLVANSIIGEFPKRLWTYFIQRAQLSETKRWADLNREEINRLTKTLEEDVYKANGKTTFKEEFVTCGGIELSEVDMKSMQSKKHPGLFFAGEVLNMDAVTGGYNFQSAWTTSYRAAVEMSK